MNKHYVYMVRCSDDTLYTGYTNDIDKRVEAHSKGLGAKYTRGRGPVKLVYYECYNDKIHAMKREYQIKQLSRKNKENLIREGSEKVFESK
ncbi:MAG: GIY-YIG nuclease family protein [Tissierellia bacterium]|nr:GIY-YIG nuclease family protein [Tissierellia bacterium]